MKNEIKLIRKQTPASPRKKTLGRVVALLALLTLVLAIPASAKYFELGDAVFSTELDSALYTGTAPITVTGTAIGVNSTASVSSGSAALVTSGGVYSAIAALTTWETLEVTANNITSAPVVQLNKALMQIKVRFDTQRASSNDIGLTLCTIKYPDGYAPSSARRVLVSMDYTSIGRESGLLDFQVNGKVLLYPHTPTQFTGQVNELNGAQLFTDIIFYL